MATSLLQWLLSTDYKDKGVKDAQKDLKGLKQGAADLITQLTGVNMTGLTAIGMLAGLGAAVKKAVDFTVEYTDQVRTMSNLTGMSAEETSRLIQVSDDYGIEADKLKAILTGANKAGFLPTIENLAALSDQYLAIQDPLEQNRLLTEKLGKAGMDYADVIKLGGDAIREKAAAVEDGLILDEAAVKAGLEYKQAMDGVEDSLNAMRIQLAQNVIPALSKFLEFMARGISVGNQLINWNRNVKSAWDEHNISMQATSTTYEEYINEMVRAAEAAGYDFDEMEKLTGIELTQADRQQMVITNYGALTEEQWNAMKANQDLQGSLEDTNTALEDATTAVADYSTELKLLKEAIGGPVGKELDNYAEKMRKIETETADAQAVIDELGGKKWLTGQQKEDLEEARKKLEELGAQATTTAEEHRQAMGKIIYDMAAVRAAADGVITEAEYNTLKTYAQNMGIVDQATVDAQYALQLMDETIKNSPQSADNYARALQVMTDRLDDGKLSADDLKAILDTLKGTAWNVTVSTDVDASELDSLEERIRRGYRIPVTVSGNGNWIPMAEGGEGVVTRPTLFLAGEAGVPERYSFTPLDGRHGSGDSGGGVTINMYGSVNNGMDLEEFVLAVAERLQRR